MQSMICSNCGAEIRETTRFCPHCGRAANPVAGVPTILMATPVALTGLPYPTTSFSKNTIRSVLASLAILIVALISIVFIDALREQITLLDRLDDVRAGSVGRGDARILVEDVRHNDTRIKHVNQTWIGWLVIAGIIYLFWVHRAYKNLRAFRVAGLRRTPGWAVGGFLIPLANFWLPFPMMREIWRASAPDAIDSAKTGRPWYLASVTPLITLWWFTFVASSVMVRLAQVVKPSVKTPDDLDKLRNYDLFIIGDLIVLVVASALAIAVVQLVSNRQRDAATELDRRDRLAVESVSIAGDI